MRISRSATAAGLEQRELIVAGRRVRFGVTGRGDPLVLVHGLAGSAAWWSRNLASLSRRRRVYLLDLPGFGGMHGTRAYLRSRDAAAWIASFMGAAGLVAADVAGHSMGGMVALRLAARRPELVRRLALIAPAGMPAERRPLGYLAPLLRSARRFEPSFALVLARDVARAGPLTLLDAARGVLAADVRADLERVRAPILLVWGERDLIVPPSLAGLFQAQAPQARLALVPGAGHVPMYERPRAFEAALLAFLDDQPPSTAARNGSTRAATAPGSL